MPALKALLAILALAACAPTIPDQNPGGVGFGDYTDYARQRDQGLLQGQVPVQPNATFSTDAVGAALDASDNGGVAPQAGYAPAPAYGDTSQYGQLQQAPVASGIGPGGLDPNRPRGDAPAGIRTESGEMARAGGLSDDSFKAVSGRETIESDKERLARQRAEYEVIQPTALPQRTGKAEPNIVQFALNTSHLPGTKMYNRSSLFGGGGGSCNRYASPDQAQEAFLAAGGPEKDSKGLDPDGDGFACGWDPRPFRTALR